MDFFGKTSFLLFSLNTRLRLRAKVCSFFFIGCKSFQLRNTHTKDDTFVSIVDEPMVYLSILNESNFLI
jgi:hypothetical protein